MNWGEGIRSRISKIKIMKHEKITEIIIYIDMFWMQFWCQLDDYYNGRQREVFFAKIACACMINLKGLKSLQIILRQQSWKSVSCFLIYQLHLPSSSTHLFHWVRYVIPPNSSCWQHKASRPMDVFFAWNASNLVGGSGIPFPFAPTTHFTRVSLKLRMHIFLVESSISLQLCEHDCNVGVC